MSKFLWSRPRPEGAYRQFDAGKVPALWRRVADRPDAADLLARYGMPMTDGAFVSSQPHAAGLLARWGRSDGLPVTSGALTPEEMQNLERLALDQWSSLATDLAKVSALWTDAGDGLFVLPAVALARNYAVELLGNRLSDISLAGHVRVRAESLNLVPEAWTLTGFLWMSAAADVRGQQRFRRCAQCGEWFPVARTDARYCSSTCRGAAMIERTK